METSNEITVEIAAPEMREAAPAAATVRRNAYGLSAQAEAFEKARFGWMAILLTAQSCLGAVACMLISLRPENLFALCACAAVTMGSNALFIALAPPRVTLAGFYISVLVNSALIFTNL